MSGADDEGRAKDPPEEGDGDEHGSELVRRPDTALPGQPSLPESPFTTETIEFMQADERLGVVLRGGRVGARSVPTSVAGPFLYRFHQLVHAVAAVLSGRRLGSRGSLPPVVDAGLLALLGVEWGSSVTFHLGIGPGEQARIGDSGEMYSITEDALSIVSELVVTSASGDGEGLWSRTRDLGPRVGTNYDRFIEVFVQQEVDSIWQFATYAGRAVDLSATRAYRAKQLLEYEELPRVYEMEMRGYLYRVDSREHEFILDPEGEHEDKVTGTYPEHLREDLRNAWDHVVHVRLRTTHRFLARQLEPADVEYELIEVFEISE